ncbi:nascent polypeptide-associated complex subunit beta [Staphylotrichum tortipilum]|uniref:Nascent polypeptide-associated complex subunit beta n=1 Tax=Staphylotrichum tortipilum TaxID=2831512 RepID=A0AAN6RQP3_9PEZI|nr:nascent polypeptide-associated complex subunit beta [Staphylotrichum longicolle]
MAAKKPVNWWLWAKMAVVGGGIIWGGPALVRYVSPTDEELFQKYSPELQKRSLEGRQERQQEFDDFVMKLKEYSKSDKPIWVVQAEAEKNQGRKAATAEALRLAEEAKARKEEMRKEAGLSTKSGAQAHTISPTKRTGPGSRHRGPITILRGPCFFASLHRVAPVISNLPTTTPTLPLPIPTHSNMADVQERLKKLGATARIGTGKGTPRRKVKRAPARSAGDDKKLQQSLKKLNVQPIQAIEEVNMFKSDGNVIHFAAPKVHAAVPANTFAIYGNGEDKELTELVPGILNQLGPDSLASLRKLAESYQNMQKGEKEADDDDIPDLVAGENFENKVE